MSVQFRRAEACRTLAPRTAAGTPTCATGPGEQIDHAVAVTRQQHVRRLPVIDDGHPVGIVSLGDIAIERDRGSVLCEISAGLGNT